MESVDSNGESSNGKEEQVKSVESEGFLVNHDAHEQSLKSPTTDSVDHGETISPMEENTEELGFISEETDNNSAHFSEENQQTQWKATGLSFKVDCLVLDLKEESNVVDKKKFQKPAKEECPEALNKTKKPVNCSRSENKKAVQPLCCGEKKQSKNTLEVQSKALSEKPFTSKRGKETGNLKNEIKNDGRQVAPSQKISNANVSTEDAQEKTKIASPCQSAGSPSPVTDEISGRRKRKPSRYHDSMFDIPTKLMNINRIVPPEEFKAFHNKSKAKEKSKKLSGITENVKKKGTKPGLDSLAQKKKQISPTLKNNVASAEEGSISSNNLFKFKMGREHVIQNSAGSPTSYRCDICMMMFPRSFSLRRHYVRRHINPKYVLPKSSPSKKSPQGKSTNGTSSSLATDSADLKDSENNPKGNSPKENEASTADTDFLYACKVCSKSLLFFKSKTDLKLHCEEKHSSAPRRPISIYKCNTCQRSYSTRHELERHTRTHSGERPYACNYCSKTFPTSTNARRHERTHTGDRPHICKVCNKGFIQRTDMVKHLRSVHKMKVTKTKAERAFSKGKMIKYPLKDNFKGDSRKGENDLDDLSNQFQENIDFAAYLKLDQHDSGTLMGENKVGLTTDLMPIRSTTTKQIQENNSNNQPVKQFITKDNKPETKKKDVIGDDGRPDRCHRCPDCPKMFTSNINLRRHHKLKHERMQLFQSAEPVSMVVEKYKIRDENDVSLSAKDNTNPIQKPKLEDSHNIATVKKSLEIQETAVKKQEEITNGSNEDNSKVEHTSEQNEEVFKKSKDEETKNILKVNQKPESKLNSIVQRLNDLRKNTEPDHLAPSEEYSSMSPPELQPIVKLEEMENQLLKDYYSSDNSSNISPRRKKRKPLNVYHVTPSWNEDQQEIVINAKPKLLPVLKSSIMKPISSFKPAFPPKLIRDNHPTFFQEDFNPYESRIRQRRHFYEHEQSREKIITGMNQKFLDSERERSKKYTPIYNTQDKQASFHDISKSFAPLTTRPFTMDRGPPIVSKTDKTGNSVLTSCPPSSRFQTFLSQCWSSKKHNIPQNATLGVHQTRHDGVNMMIPKLKQSKQISNEKPSTFAVFNSSTERRVSDHACNMNRVEEINKPFPWMKSRSQTEMSPMVPSPHLKVEESFINSTPVPEIVHEDNGQDSPLDLRHPSKKPIQDYIVRNDGVLDFSRRTKNVPTMKASTVRTAVNRDSHPVTKSNSWCCDGNPIHKGTSSGSAQASHFGKIPSKQEVGRFLNQPSWSPNSGYVAPSPNPNINSRRPHIHGDRRNRRPFKFHPINFEGSRPGGPPPLHPTNPKNFNLPMSGSSKSYRSHPYFPSRMNTVPYSPHYSQQKRLGSPLWRIPQPSTSMQHRHPQMKNHGGHNNNVGGFGCSYAQCSICEPSHRFLNPSMAVPPVPSKRIPDPMRKNRTMFNRIPLNAPMEKIRNSHVKNKYFILSPKSNRFEINYKERRGEEIIHNRPFEYSESDMMMRCIQKAQKALENENSSGPVGNESQENALILPDPAPVFKPSMHSTKSPVNMKKNNSTTNCNESQHRQYLGTNLLSRSLKTMGQNDPHRLVPLHGPKLTLKNQSYSVNEEYIRPHNKVSGIGPPPPLFPDVKTPKSSDISSVDLSSKETFIQSSEKSNLKILQEYPANMKISETKFNNETSRRQILTQTPELEEDDLSCGEGALVIDISENEQNDVKMDAQKTDFMKVTAQTTEKEASMNDDQKRVKDEHNLINHYALNMIVLRKPDVEIKYKNDSPFGHSMKELTVKKVGKDTIEQDKGGIIPHEVDKTSNIDCDDEESKKVKISCESPGKSETIGNDTKKNIGKVLKRRHTDAAPTSTQDLKSENHKSILSRSNSSDSQTEMRGDESDRTSRKLIKKLKLRVIKSPGSEHKKYWTLVDPNPNEQLQNNQIEIEDAQTLQTETRFCPFCKLPLKDRRTYNNHTSHCVGRFAVTSQTFSEKVAEKMESEIKKEEQSSKCDDENIDPKASASEDKVKTDKGESLDHDSLQEEGKCGKFEVEEQENLDNIENGSEKEHGANTSVSIDNDITEPAYVRVLTNHDVAHALEAIDHDLELVPCNSESTPVDEDEVNDEDEDEGSINQDDIDNMCNDMLPSTNEDFITLNLEEDNMAMESALVEKNYLGQKTNLNENNNSKQVKFISLGRISPSGNRINNLIAAVEVSSAKINRKMSELRNANIQNCRLVSSNIPQVIMNETAEGEKSAFKIPAQSDKLTNVGHVDSHSMESKYDEKDCQDVSDEMKSSQYRDEESQDVSDTDGKIKKPEFAETATLEEISVTRMTRSSIVNMDGNKLDEKKKNVVLKKNDGNLPICYSRLRRSVRRRQCSADKDSSTSRKKK